MSKIICCYHSKDLDGYTSGAIIRRAFPGCELIGWDYGNPVPDLGKGNRIVIIDICFPMEDMLKIAEENHVTWIDHHISQKKEWDMLEDDRKNLIIYNYDQSRAACEIAWEHFFWPEPQPECVELLGKYDTWRENGTKEWTDKILPFQFYMRTVCTKPEEFPEYFFGTPSEAGINIAINIGGNILKYQQQQDMLKCERGAFEREVFGKLKALCLNEGMFSSETMKTCNPEKYDVLLGFVYNKSFWRVSLRTLKDDVDVSVIAKVRGGGGHKKASGFEVKTFEEIFI